MSKKSEEFSKKKKERKKKIETGCTVQLKLLFQIEDELRGGTKVQYQIKKDDFEV